MERVRNVIEKFKRDKLKRQQEIEKLQKQLEAARHSSGSNVTTLKRKVPPSLPPWARAAVATRLTCAAATVMCLCLCNNSWNLRRRSCHWQRYARMRGG